MVWVKSQDSIEETRIEGGRRGSTSSPPTMPRIQCLPRRVLNELAEHSGSSISLELTNLSGCT